MIHDVGFLDADLELDRLTMQALFPLFGFCMAYFLDYSFSALHSSEECPGPCHKHVLSALVVLSLGDTAFFVLSLPEWNFSGLVGEADFPPFIY